MSELFIIDINDIKEYYFISNREKDFKKIAELTFKAYIYYHKYDSKMLVDSIYLLSSINIDQVVKILEKINSKEKYINFSLQPLQKDNRSLEDAKKIFYNVFDN